MPLRWLGPKVPLEVGEAWCLKARQGGDAISGKQMPVPRLPGGGKTLIPRQTKLQERHECWRENEEANDLTITGDLRMTFEKELTNRERTGDHFAEQHYSSAAIEHRINRVEGVAVGARS